MLSQLVRLTFDQSHCGAFQRRSRRTKHITFDWAGRHDIHQVRVVFRNEGYNGVFIRPGRELLSLSLSLSCPKARRGLTSTAHGGSPRQRTRDARLDRPNVRDGNGSVNPPHGGGGGDGRGLSLEGLGGVGGDGGGGGGLAGYQSQSIDRMQRVTTRVLTA